MSPWLLARSAMLRMRSGFSPAICSIFAGSPCTLIVMITDIQLLLGRGFVSPVFDQARPARSTLAIPARAGVIVATRRGGPSVNRPASPVDRLIGTAIGGLRDGAA